MNLNKLKLISIALIITVFAQPTKVKAGLFDNSKDVVINTLFGSKKKQFLHQ